MADLREMHEPIALPPVSRPVLAAVLFLFIFLPAPPFAAKASDQVHPGVAIEDTFPVPASVIVEEPVQVPAGVTFENSALVPAGVTVEDSAQARSKELTGSLDLADRLMASGDFDRARRVLEGVIKAAPDIEEGLLAGVAMADLENRAARSGEPAHDQPAAMTGVPANSDSTAGVGDPPAAETTATNRPLAAVEPHAPVKEVETPVIGTGSADTAVMSSAPVKSGRVKGAADARAEKYEALALKMSPASRPSMLLRAGEAYLDAGDFARAVEVLRKAAEGADGKTLGATYLALAVACEKSLDFDGRDEALEKCVVLGGAAARVAERMLQIIKKEK